MILNFILFCNLRVLFIAGLGSSKCLLVSAQIVCRYDTVINLNHLDSNTYKRIWFYWTTFKVEFYFTLSTLNLCEESLAFKIDSTYCISER